MRSSVDLPAPFGPSSAVTPGPTSKLNVGDGDDVAEPLRDAFCRHAEPRRSPDGLQAPVAQPQHQPERAEDDCREAQSDEPVESSDRAAVFRSARRGSGTTGQPRRAGSSTGRALRPRRALDAGADDRRRHESTRTVAIAAAAVRVGEAGDGHGQRGEQRRRSTSPSDHDPQRDRGASPALGPTPTRKLTSRKSSGPTVIEQHRAEHRHPLGGEVARAVERAGEVEAEQARSAVGAQRLGRQQRREEDERAAGEEPVVAVRDEVVGSESSGRGGEGERDEGRDEGDGERDRGQTLWRPPAPDAEDALAR